MHAIPKFGGGPNRCRWQGVVDGRQLSAIRGRAPVPPFPQLEHSMKHTELNPAGSDGTGTGIPELDAEERRLSGLVHELNRAIADGRGADEIRQLMNRVLLDAVSHFEHEEQVFATCAYPLPKGHAALHRQMTAELEHAMEVLRDVETRATWAEYGLLVAQLFDEHMRQETTKYRNFVCHDSGPDWQGD
jgi:hemerythrin-like metal-binding protein